MGDDNNVAAGESNAPPPLRRVICHGCRGNGELERRIERSNRYAGNDFDFPEGESLSSEERELLGVRFVHGPQILLPKNFTIEE